MSLAVVVVAYGAADLLTSALAPLTGLQVVVVDNSSDPDVARAAAAAGAEYVDPGLNLGFGAGVNLGAETLRTRGVHADLLVLNPDAVIAAGQVAALQAALCADPRLAVVSPALVGADGHVQRVAWPFPAPARMWREAVGLGRVNDRHAEWLTGAVLLLRAQAWEQVGPFDERFFLYQEETDWQRRAVAAGWTVRLLPEVVATHVGAATSTDPCRREQLFHAGTETYVRKWFGAAGWTSYRAAALTGALARSILPGDRGAAARRRARLYARGPRRVAGLDVGGATDGADAASSSA